MDWISDNLYWSAEDLGMVVVSRVDGRYPHVLMSNIGRPRGIDVNPNTGYVPQNSATNRAYESPRLNSAIHKTAGRRSAGGWNDPPPPRGSFQPPAPFTAYGSFRNCTRQNHGMAGNREASGFVNSAVKLFLHLPSTSPFL